MLKLINTSIWTGQAWKILEVAYEGTSKVKTSRLQILRSKFESLRMMEEESIADFIFSIHCAHHSQTHYNSISVE